MIRRNDCRKLACKLQASPAGKPPSNTNWPENTKYWKDLKGSKGGTTGLSEHLINFGGKPWTFDAPHTVPQFRMFAPCKTTMFAVANARIHGNVCGPPQRWKKGWGQRWWLVAGKWVTLKVISHGWWNPTKKSHEKSPWNSRLYPLVKVYSLRTGKSHVFFVR